MWVSHQIFCCWENEEKHKRMENLYTWEMDQFYVFLVILDTQTAKSSSKTRKTLSVTSKTVLNLVKGHVTLKRCEIRCDVRAHVRWMLFTLYAGKKQFSNSYFLHKFRIFFIIFTLVYSTSIISIIHFFLCLSSFVNNMRFNGIYLRMGRGQSYYCIFLGM